MIFKVSSLLCDEVQSSGSRFRYRYHPITHASIPASSAVTSALEFLCGPREIEDLQNETRALLQEELFYRGILTPVHVENEREYWQQRFPLEPSELSFFKGPRSMVDRVKTPWAVIGVPFDNGAGKPGCRYGPQLLRERSNGWCFRSKTSKPGLYNVSSKRSLPLGDMFSDLGDLRLRSDDNAESVSAKYLGAIDKLPETTRLFTIGGDHSITSAPVLALQKKYPAGKGLCYVHIDQHTDLQSWGTWSDGELVVEELRHSNFVSHIKQKMPEIQVHQIGIRRHQSLPDANRQTWEGYLENSVHSFIDDIDVATSDYALLATKLPKGQTIYLSIDVDGISSSHVKQTGYPSATGLDVGKLFSIVDYLCRHNQVVGADMMEFGKSAWPSEHQSESDLLLSLMLSILENAP